MKKSRGVLSPIFSIFQSQSGGLILVILALGVLLTALAGEAVDNLTGQSRNSFLNPDTLMQVAKNASYFAIMAVGATMVIISGGIDLSVGSIYAISGVMTAMLLRLPALHDLSPFLILLTGVAVCLGVGALCGAVNGGLVVGLGVHPFIITLGFMLILRGIAFLASGASSIPLPYCITATFNASLGLGKTLQPVPMLVMLLVAILGSLHLTRTVAGRHIFAVGGNADAARYAGLRQKRILIGVYALSGLAAGIAELVNIGYSGTASSADGTGYELYVIASAVVGGASLMGGKGSAFNAMLGAILLALIKQSIDTLHISSNYETPIIGCAIIIAVVLDQTSSHLAARRLVRAPECEPADAAAP